MKNVLFPKKYGRDTTNVNNSSGMVMFSLIQCHMTLVHPLVLMSKPQLVLMSKSIIQTFRASRRQYLQPKEDAKGRWMTMMHLSLISKVKQHPVDQGAVQNVTKLDTIVRRVGGLNQHQNVQEGGHLGPVQEGAEEEGGSRGGKGVMIVVQKVKMKFTILDLNKTTILHHQHQKTKKKGNR